MCNKSLIMSRSIGESASAYPVAPDGAGEARDSLVSGNCGSMLGWMGCGVACTVCSMGGPLKLSGMDRDVFMNSANYLK